MSTPSRYTVKSLDITGWATLPPALQQVIHHLTDAGDACADLVYQQFGLYNLAVRNVLADLLTYATLTAVERSLISDLQQTVWACNGIYHDTHGDRLTPPCTAAQFQAWCLDPALQSAHTDRALAFQGLFGVSTPATLCSPSTPQASGFIWQHGGVTPEERLTYIQEKEQGYLDRGQPAPLYGINLVLTKTPRGELLERRYAVGQLFSDALEASCSHLQLAADAAIEYPALQKSITTLIRFYQTGDPVDFDLHCLAWLENKDCPVYFSQGFIERLDDPQKQIGSYQSIVAFKDPVIAAKTDKIVSQAAWIESALPIPAAFKRPNPTGVHGSAFRIVSSVGACNPILPLGNVLPNNKWIRQERGSFSALFINTLEQNIFLSPVLLSRFVAPSHHATLHAHFTPGYHAVVMLHECAGHASGQFQDGVSQHALGALYGIIEEARADLVAYYMLGDASFVASILPEVTDHDAFARAMYAEYLAQGTRRQLIRIPIDATDYGAATHFRNRQLNNAYVLERALKAGHARYVATDYGDCVEVMSMSGVRALYGELLSLVQTIKSTGDLAAAQALIDRYATSVNTDHVQDAHRRVVDLDLAAQVAFERPVLDKMA